MNPKPVIAAFDFDGTITTKDTLWYFLAQVTSLPRFLYALTFSGLDFCLAVIWPDLRAQSKQRFISRCLRGRSIDQVEKGAMDFSLKGLPRLVNQAAVKRIEFHKARGDTVVVVSASALTWIEPWARQHQVDLCLCTELETVHNIFTGVFRSPNCNGEEKRRRFLHQFPNRQDYELFYYGDSSGDQEMLDMADHAFFRRFN